MDEVEGAVDGVDDEGGRVGDLGGAGDEGFFADEGVGGVEGGEAGGDEGFDGAVGGGYEVRGWGGLVMSEGWGGRGGGQFILESMGMEEGSAARIMAPASRARAIRSSWICLRLGASAMLGGGGDADGGGV